MPNPHPSTRLRPPAAGLCAALLLSALAAATPARAEEDPWPISAAEACEEAALPEFAWSQPAAEAVRAAQLTWLTENPAAFHQLQFDPAWSPFALERLVLKHANIKKVIQRMLGSGATARADGPGRVLYEAADSSVKIRENVWYRNFTLSLEVPGEEPVPLNSAGLPARRSDPRLLQYFSRHRPGSLSGRVARDIGLVRKLLLLATEKGSVREHSQRRVEMHGANWARHSLAEGIHRFLGTHRDELVVREDRQKVAILNLVRNVGIVDDPNGHYYKLVRVVGNRWIPMDWYGRISFDDHRADLHFSYEGLDPLAGLRESQQGPELRLSSELDDYAMARVNRLLASELLNSSVARVRMKAIASLRWDRMSPAERIEFVNRVSVHEFRDLAERERFYQLILRANDPSWLPLLDRWSEQHSGSEVPERALFGRETGRLARTLRLAQEVAALEQELEAGRSSFPERAAALLERLELARQEVSRSVWATVGQPALAKALSVLGKLAERSGAGGFTLTEFRKFSRHIQDAILANRRLLLSSEGLDEYDYDWIAHQLGGGEVHRWPAQINWLRLLTRGLPHEVAARALRRYLGPEGDSLPHELRATLRESLLNGALGRWRSQQLSEEQFREELKGLLFLFSGQAARLGEEFTLPGAFFRELSERWPPTLLRALLREARRRAALQAPESARGN